MKKQVSGELKNVISQELKELCGKAKNVREGTCCKLERDPHLMKIGI